MDQFKVKIIKEQIANNEEGIKNLESIIELIAMSTQRNPLTIQIERNEASISAFGLVALRSALMCKILEFEQNIRELNKMLI